MIQARILALRSKTDEHLRKSQARYKHDYDRRVRETPTFHKGKYVFPDKPPLANVSNSPAEMLAWKPHNKLQSRTTGPFRVVSEQKDTIAIDEEGIPNRVSIDRITHAPLTATQLQQSVTSARPDLDVTGNDTPKAARPTDTNKDEYVVDRIVRHIGKGDTLRYVVRWYGYGPQDDTIEPPQHIPQHFITRH